MKNGLDQYGFSLDWVEIPDCCQNCLTKVEMQSEYCLSDRSRAEQAVDYWWNMKADSNRRFALYVVD